jgi:hypothetical protein
MKRSAYVGTAYITGTSAYQGPFGAFTALTESVINTATDWSDLSGTAVSGMPVPAGVTIFGNIRSITLSSGSGLAYRI